MSSHSVKFPRDGRQEFYAELRKRVNQYFKDNDKSRYGDYRMYIKTAAMIAAYIGTYLLIITQFSSDFWVNLGLWCMMGVAIAGIGLSVMHDASHGAYSKNKRINRILANIMVFIGGSEFTWNIQHNQKHHSFTNVDGIDEDIDPGAVMRFSPHKKRYWIHRYQHLYAWFLYGLMTITWSTEKDFKQLIQYKKQNLLGPTKTPFSTLMFRMVMNKVIFHFILIGLPIILLPDPWYLIIAYNLIMHFVAGFILACVFQPAHVMPTSEYPLPDDKGSMENNWAVHQLLTTANFSPNSRIFSWYVGGLNYQIEHHLFPNICHVHHKDISKIVEKTAKEYGLPYNVQPNFMKALWEHGKMLRHLGRVDYVPVKS